MPEMKREVDNQVAAPAEPRTPNLHRAKIARRRVRMEGWRQVVGYAQSETSAAPVARALATTNQDPYAETRGLSGLRGRVTEAQRRCFGDAGICAGKFSGDSPGGTGSTGPCVGLEVRRSSSPLPAMRDL